MTKEDIIAMAKKATEGGIEIAVFTVEELERFAALVSSAEREACAKICDEADKDSDWPTAANCAEAIRARNKQ